jgi:cytoskeletal protein RodZ
MSIIESANGVGARLAEARSQQGLSVEDLSSRTYIRPTVIRGIENDDFTACGGPFYARGHIRTLARTLGLDEAPLLQQFDRQHGAPEPRIAVEPAGNEPAALRSVRTRSDRSGSGWMAVATVVLIVICVVLLVSVLVGGPSKDNRPATAPPPSAARTSAAPSAPAATPSTPAPAARTYSGVNLEVKLANGPSWVRVTDENGNVLASNVGAQGMSAEFRGAQSLRFTFGNAGAVSASCNGKDLGSLGGQGQVVTRTLVLNDPACGPSTG